MDLSQLSDDELRKIAGQEPPPLSAMSNEQLTAIAGAPKNDYSAVDAFTIAAGKGLTRLGQGAQDVYYSATGNNTERAKLDQRVAEQNRLYKPLADAHPLATGLGEAAPSLPLGPLGLAFAGALEHGTPEERATRSALGFVGGKAGEYVGKGIGRLAQPVREATADATSALFKKYGLDALPGQIANSAPIRWAESALASLPGGGRIRAIQEAQQVGLNRAATGAMGKADDLFTPEAVGAAKSVVGGQFDSIPQGTVVGVDKPLAQRLLQVEQNHYKNLSPDQRSIVRQYVDDILDFGPTGMPGDVYQKARSRIGARAESTQDSELKTALKGVQKSLDDAFARSATPEKNAAYAKAREQWGAIKDFGPLANVDGVLSGARAATAGKNAPKGSAVRDVAELGAKMRPMRSSGTAERLMYQSALSGGLGGGAGLVSGDPTEAAKWAGGALAAPWLASQLLTRAPVKNYLTKGLLDVTPEMERALRRLGGASGGLLGLSLGP
jgi:hypothetical protein